METNSHLNTAAELNQQHSTYEYKTDYVSDALAPVFGVPQGGHYVLDANNRIVRPA